MVWIIPVANAFLQYLSASPPYRKFLCPSRPFLKETFLYIALFPDFIRIFIDWKNE